MTVGKVIYNILANDIDVSGLVGTRIYPNSINYDSTTMPAVVYTETDNDPTNTKSTVSQLDQINILISCFAETYSQADDLAIKVRKAFESNYGTEETNSEVQVQSIEFVESQDMFDDDFGQWGINYKQLNFKVRIKRTLTSPDTIMVFDTRITNLNSTDENSLLLPLYNANNDFTIDWGDGNTESVTGDTHITHTYSTPGIKQVKISGNRFHLRYSQSPTSGATYGNKDPQKLIEIKNWGIFRFMNSAVFSGCVNMDITATDIPILESSSSMNTAFNHCYKLIFNNSINNWDVSNCTSFYACFSRAPKFNQPLDNWDMSNATSISSMFYYAVNFNQDLNSWDTTNLSHTTYSFGQAINFNGKIGNWRFKTSGSVDTGGMFSGASSFNQYIGDWNTETFFNMNQMFSNVYFFDQNLNSWNVSNVTNMYRVLYNAESYDQPMNNWDISNVTDFRDFLKNAHKSLSTANYDSLLISWGAQDVSLNESINFGGSQYTSGGAAEAARTFLITNKGWTITDGGAA